MAPIVLLGPLFCAAAYTWAFWGLLNWKGRLWRWLAAVPFIGVALWMLIVLAPAWAKDKSSHNLWPFEVGMLFWPSLPYIAIVAACRRWGRGAAPTPGAK